MPASSPIPTIETDRLRLRAFRADDLAPYAAMLGDEEVVRHTFAGRVSSPAEAWSQMAGHLGHWALKGYGLWAVEECRSGALIGRVGLYDPEGAPWPDFSWMLARAAWGQGYGTEAAAHALRWTFEATALPRVVSLVESGNARSVAVAERLGLKRGGELPILRRTWLVYGASSPSVIPAERSASRDREQE